MWLFDRRAILLGGAALGACGFTPAYGPGGTGAKLLGQIATDAPETRDQFVFNQRFEERMGRASGPYKLSVKLGSTRQGIGSISGGDTTRFRLVGQASYTLTRVGEKDPLVEGRTEAFTGYSSTGSTAATLAAERDAKERLMLLLADQVIDSLILKAAELGA